jgi:hypothetical protein
VKRRAAAVWDGMRCIYGTGFETMYGDVPNAYWIAGIVQLSDEQCRKGLSALARESREYPANLTEFVEACKPKQHVRYLGANPTTPERYRKSLARQLAAPEVIAQHLDRMRASVRAKGIPTNGYRARADAAEARRPPAPCTCEASGKCPVCVGYMDLYEPIPREVPRETEAT